MFVCSTCVRRVTRSSLMLLCSCSWCLGTVSFSCCSFSSSSCWCCTPTRAGAVTHACAARSCWCCYSRAFVSLVCLWQVACLPCHSCSARVLVLDCSSWCDPQLMNDLLLVLMLLVLMALIGAHGAAPNNQCAAPTACAGAGRDVKHDRGHDRGLWKVGYP